VIVRIEVVKDGDGNYDAFPQDKDLEKFDLSDRKFVAVAITSAQNPEIVNAVDSDWKNHQTALEKYVKLKFLCK
jgi:hypothetical protein